MDISVKSDLDAAIKHLNGYRDNVVIPAANSALTRCANAAKTQSVRHISQQAGIKPARIVRERITVTPSTYHTLAAMVTAKGRRSNMIDFVNQGKRHPGAFAKKAGVVAKPWGKTHTFPHTFIVNGRNSGKPIVVAVRAGATRHNGKWTAGWSKSIYGPGIASEFVHKMLQLQLNTTIANTWQTEFNRQIQFRLSRLNK